MELKGCYVSVSGEIFRVPREHYGGMELKGRIKVYFDCVQLCTFSVIKRLASWSETQRSKSTE